MFDAVHSPETSHSGLRIIDVPFFRPDISDNEISAVVETLRSGWLTTGPQTKEFEREFADAVNARFAVAVNSCTAALHLAVEAMDLKEGDAVLVPTMTFAATAEIILYQKAIPILVDCDPATGNMDLADAARKLKAGREGRLQFLADGPLNVVGIIPVHVGGYMMDIDELSQFAKEHSLWAVEDAAHAFPAAWRKNKDSDWTRCGESTANVTCYSFYANKTITTGEGGMAVTNDEALAERMRLMSLHGLSNQAWKRFAGGSWDYKILYPGYKYNLTDIASAIGRGQLERAEDIRSKREAIAMRYAEAFATVSSIGLPPNSSDRVHSWHLFPIRLLSGALSITRDDFIEELKKNGIGCSVHWRPLHLHPLYAERFKWPANEFAGANILWHEIVSLPIFSTMSDAEIDRVIDVVLQLVERFAAAPSTRQ